MGWGEMTTRAEVPPRRRPWAFDNGAFLDWRRGRDFDGDAYQRALERVEGPDFLIVPDIVAGGRRSLDFSLGWVDRLRGVAPLYLAVQDGMSACDVLEAAPDCAGLFVGGSLPWKVRTGHEWVQLAHCLGKPCHIGRVGAVRRVAWAMRIGADSIDSCLPLWSRENLARFRAALEDRQMELIQAPEAGA